MLSFLFLSVMYICSQWIYIIRDEEDVDGMQDAGVAMLRAYNYVCDEVDSQSAFDAIISVSSLYQIKRRK